MVGRLLADAPSVCEQAAYNEWSKSQVTLVRAVSISSDAQSRMNTGAQIG